MFTPRFLRSLPLVCGVLLLLLAACGQPGSTTSGNSATTVMTIGSTPSASLQAKSALPSAPATVAMPSVQRSCPAAGTARAAVMAPLALGNHANIVYIVNEQSGSTPTFGTLKRYDVVTGQKTEVIKLAGTFISEAQVSADGQWLLFVAIVARQARLQLIRMDGQGLQTLYCVNGASNGAYPTSALSHVQWSTDQRLAAFDSYTDAGSALLVLTVHSGALQRDLFAPGSGIIYPVRTWLDTKRLYLAGPMIDGPSNAVYLLDSTRGGNQTTANLQQVFDASAVQFCWDFDSSYDGTQLFTSQCKTTPNPHGPGEGNQSGPSSITVRPATGGAAKTILNAPSLAIVGLRVISPSTLLLQTQSVNTATANNGLWKVKANGSGLTPLITFGGGVGAAGQSGSLNRYTQYPWSNVSRNGSLYAFEGDNSLHGTVTLLFGSLNGGATTTFASIGDGTQLSIVGWTTV